MEILATKAERDSIKLMQIKYMSDKEGEIFEAVISGVIPRGVFVEIVENKCEGLVKAKDLPGDYFTYDLGSQMRLPGFFRLWGTHFADSMLRSHSCFQVH